ncbi:MAG: CoA ester lyase [Chloroflexi bacterium]|nr:CoA ester lyase [Chloroflexota bacterium]
MELLRSLLFVPGNRQDMLEKARMLPADALLPDMEDSVPFPEKAKARETIAKVLPTLAGRGQKVIPRANSLATGLLEADLAAVIGPHIYGVTVGKIDGVWDVQQVDAIIAALERRAGQEPGRVKLVPWVETAKGMVHAYDICRASPRIIAVAFGGDDYLTDMGLQRTETGEELVYARSVVAVAARAAGIPAVDSPYNNFRDAEGLKREVQKVRSLGMKGKCAIHPSQVEVISQGFSPAPEEVEYARRVVQSYDEAAAQGRGAVSLDGRMIDQPIVARARNLLALAEAIRKAEEVRG